MEKLLFESISGDRFWNEEKVKNAYINLRPHLDRFKKLSKIKRWEFVKDNVIIYTQLQEAYDIMLGCDIKRSHSVRCRPCERMALACIKDLVGDRDYEPLKLEWAEPEEWEIKEQIELLQFTQDELDEAINQANSNIAAYKEHYKKYAQKN